MTKELKDIATEKPEDIVRELEERAKTKETDPGDAPEKTETAELETPEEAPVKGDAAEEPAPPEKEEPPLLKRLRAEPGMEKHSYKDEEALVKSHASLRKRLSARDEDAALGRALRDAGVSPEDIAEVFKSQPEPAKGKDTEPPKWDPAWDREIREVKDEDGNTELKGPPDMVRKYREYQAELDTFRRDPRSTILDRWGIKQEIERVAETVVRRREGHQTFEAFMKDNGEFIDENRDEIVALTRKGWPATAAVEHVKLKRETEGLKTGKGSEDAKKGDLERLKGTATRRNGAAATPIKSVRDLANLPLRDAINAKLAEQGKSIPSEW